MKELMLILKKIYGINDNLLKKIAINSLIVGIVCLIFLFVGQKFERIYLIPCVIAGVCISVSLIILMGNDRLTYFLIELSVFAASTIGIIFVVGTWYNNVVNKAQVISEINFIKLTPILFLSCFYYMAKIEKLFKVLNEKKEKIHEVLREAIKKVMKRKKLIMAIISAVITASTLGKIDPDSLKEAINEMDTE